MQQGRAIWEDECSACHRMNGEGVARFFPTLKGNPNLQQRNPTTVLHFILAGTRRSPTAGAPTPLSMPAFYWKLNDEQVAAVATYARNSWGNKAGPVSAKDVAELRAELRFDAGRRADTAAAGMGQPGPRTLAPADTDSRDNGTARAGSTAAPEPPRPATPTQDQPQDREGGHPPGRPTPGPG
jgi:cytochrome c553